jgi:hypothetical protein
VPVEAPRRPSRFAPSVCGTILKPTKRGCCPA